MNPFTKNIFYILLLVSILIGAVYLVDGCTETSCQDCQDTTMVSTKVNQVHFFLETSGSMKGYLLAGGNFTKVVSSVLSQAASISPNKIKIWTISDSAILYKREMKFFLEDFAQPQRFGNGRSSEMAKILQQVGEKASGSDIAILVSDCILSYPDVLIKKDPEINRRSAGGPLKAGISLVFRPLKKNGVGVIVYAYNSNFNGTYYDYRNHTDKVIGNEQRPFYIWVIGKQEVLTNFSKDIDSTLPKESQFEKFLTFGLFKQTVTQYQYLDSGEHEWIISTEGLEDFDSTGTFSIAVNLSDLPAYARVPSFLKKNLKYETNGIVDTNIKTEDVQLLQNVTASEDYEALDSTTHVITVKVNKLLTSQANVKISLPMLADDWYESWSTPIDTSASTRKGKTFAFKELINGVWEAYQSPPRDFISLKINLKK